MLAARTLRTLAAELQQRAQPPLATDWIDLAAGDQLIGTVAPTIAAFLERENAARRRSGVLVLEPHAAGLSAQLRSIAFALRDAGLLTGWRNEDLDVRSTAGKIVATVERAACRPLGIATTAVHLNAYVDDATLVVARRALHKPIDPGLLDNLVGGMVPAGESLQQALLREAWEEAGLRLRVDQLLAGRSFHVRRPVPEGLQSEVIHVFDTIVGDPSRLANQDGEVATIEMRAAADVVEAIARDEFTLEAALATVESLTRRQAVEPPAGLFN